uniref:fructose-bisphosphate aldolase n=1 Tax=Timema shepardi TaxID=629360 RepID=A0A7R9ARC8_TIMSH|nr:unnamed protein product [Timema shepardi]
MDRGGRTMSGLQTGPLVPTVRTQNNLSGPTGPTGGDNVAGIPTTGDRCTYVDYNYDVATAVICSMCLVFGVVYSLFGGVSWIRRQCALQSSRRTQLMKRPGGREGGEGGIAMHSCSEQPGGYFPHPPTPLLQSPEVSSYRSLSPPGPGNTPLTLVISFYLKMTQGPEDLSATPGEEPTLEEVLSKVANALVCPGKGILLTDESPATMKKRFTNIGYYNNEESRRLYRQMIFTTDDLGESISGAVLHQETLHQRSSPDDANEVPPPCPRQDELTSLGLDDLTARCKEYKAYGCHFSKARCVFQINSNTPSYSAIMANARALGRFAFLCQKSGLVPIVQAEILPVGYHGLDRMQKVTETVLSAVFKCLSDYQVFLEGCLLAVNMVTSGNSSAWKCSPQDVAMATVTTLNRTVPPAVAGVLLLSGCLSEVEATVNLNAISQFIGKKPWPITFIFGKALQGSSLRAWKGNPENVKIAQDILLEKSKDNSRAALGYRCFKAVMFLTGFIFGSIIVYLICLQEKCDYYDARCSFLPPPPGVALGAGILFGLITMLVQYVGLFMTGFHTGLFLGVISLAVAEHFYWQPSAVWMTVGVLLGGGLTVIGTSVYGGAIMAGALDYFVEKFLMVMWVWDRVALHKSSPPCWFSWLILSVWPFMIFVGLITQWAITGRGIYHQEYTGVPSKKSRNMNIQRVRTREQRAELRQKKYRYLYQVRTAHGDVISQSYVQALQRKVCGPGETNTLQSDSTHLTILPADQTQLAALTESEDDSREISGDIIQLDRRHDSSRDSVNFNLGRTSYR